MGPGHGQVPHPKLTPCQTLHYTVGAKQVELLNKTQQIVPKAGTPQEKNEEGFKIRGQGGSATKPGPNTQIIRLLVLPKFAKKQTSKSQASQTQLQLP